MQTEEMALLMATIESLSNKINILLPKKSSKKSKSKGSKGSRNSKLLELDVVEQILRKVMSTRPLDLRFKTVHDKEWLLVRPEILQPIIRAHGVLVCDFMNYLELLGCVLRDKNGKFSRMTRTKGTLENARWCYLKKHLFEDLNLLS